MEYLKLEGPETDFTATNKGVTKQVHNKASTSLNVITATTTTAFTTCSSKRNRPPLFLSLSTMAFASKKEDESGLSSYYNNKTTVIQEARVFNDTPVSPRKCRALLTRIVYLLYIGETFGTQEATTLFFGTTKLFQNKEVRIHSARSEIGDLY